jgi:hypothetical protein
VLGISLEFVFAASRGLEAERSTQGKHKRKESVLSKGRNEGRLDEMARIREKATALLG